MAKQLSDHDYAQRVGDLHRALELFAKEISEKAAKDHEGAYHRSLEVGKMLWAQKKEMAHDWEGWLRREREALGMSERTAKRYVKLARNAKTYDAVLEATPKGTLCFNIAKWVSETFLEQAAKSPETVATRRHQARKPPNFNAIKQAIHAAGFEAFEMKGPLEPVRGDPERPEEGGARQMAIPNLLVCHETEGYALFYVLDPDSPTEAHRALTTEQETFLDVTQANVGEISSVDQVEAVLAATFDVSSKK